MQNDSKNANCEPLIQTLMFILTLLCIVIIFMLGARSSQSSILAKLQEVQDATHELGKKEHQLTLLDKELKTMQTVAEK